MRLYLASDLHLEFSPLTIENRDGVDCLILAGDIMVAEDLKRNPQWRDPSLLVKESNSKRRSDWYRQFMSEVSQRFPSVVVIAGNHEFYGGRWWESLDVLREEWKPYSNVYFLEDDTVTLAGHRFIGSTLWTDMNRQNPVSKQVIKDGMNDYHKILEDRANFRYIRPDDTIQRHLASRGYITDQLRLDTETPTIVVGHHAPTYQSIDPRFRNEQHMNGAYASDLSDLILDHTNVRLWVHGHTHVDMDYMVGSTRVACHPRGYVGYERGGQEMDPYYPLLIEL